MLLRLSYCYERGHLVDYNDPHRIGNYLGQLGYRVRNIVSGDPIFPGGTNCRLAKFSVHMAELGK